MPPWSAGCRRAGAGLAAVVAVALAAGAGAQPAAAGAGGQPAAATPPILDDLALAREYDGYRTSVRGQKLYHVRYIRVATEAEAKEWIARLRSGAPFAEVARQHSLHAESAAAGGDLGRHASCRWGKATLEVLDGLRPGQVGARPVRGSHGWGIYRLESVTELVPRSFDAYKRELLGGRFDPECPWTPPMALESGRPGDGARHDARR